MLVPQVGGAEQCTARGEGDIHGNHEAATTRGPGHRHTEGFSGILTNEPQDSQTWQGRVGWEKL